MVMRIVWAPRLTFRCLFGTMMRRCPARGQLPQQQLRNCLGDGRTLRSLLSVGGVVTLVAIVLLLSSQDAGVHIMCPCYGSTLTGEREARYLKTIMEETDLHTGRSALDQIKLEHPSLAIEFLLAQERRGSRCPLVPGLFSIRHSNTVWQEAVVGSATFLLYSAYYDDRDQEGGPMIRILGVADTAYPQIPTCHLYASDNSTPIATRAERLDFLHWQYPVSEQWQPFLISCRAGGLRPPTVSVVGYPCEGGATNALRVTNAPQQQHHQQQRAGMDSAEDSSIYEENKDKKKNTVLCHKFIYNELRDDSARLIEWIEVARAWGVDDIVLYMHTAHPNVSRVLEHYQQQGFLRVLPWTNPGHYPNIPALQRALYDTQRYALFTLENIPYTDCLLRHLPSHRYVAVWDMDEFLLPASPHTSLHQMLDSAKARWWAARAGACGLEPASAAGHGGVRETKKVQPPYLAEFNNDQVELSESGTAVYYNTSLERMKIRIISSIDRRKWSDQPAECRPPSSYVGRCSYFFDNLKEPDGQEDEADESSLHMMQHVMRSVKFAPPLVFTKGIHDTSRALGLHAHFALYSLEGTVDRQHELYQLYPASEGYLAHYRSKCQGEDQTDCKENFRPFVQRDEAMWQHRSLVTERVTRTQALLFGPRR